LGWDLDWELVVAMGQDWDLLKMGEEKVEVMD